MAPSPTPVRLSLCLIVRNEEGRLPACLESARGLADEVIVVDTGSSDRTREIALGFGARVLDLPWSGDFSRARNAGLAEARGAWILVLDADETLSPEACGRIRTLAGGRPAEAYSLIQVGKDPFGRPMRMPIVRLFPNRKEIRFEFPIHEQVDPSLGRAGIPVRTTPIEIAHSGYDSPEKATEKRLRYRGIIDAALAGAPSPAVELHLLYLSAVSWYEDRAWTRAAEEFERCLEKVASPGLNLARFARLRAAECRYQSGEFAAALKHLPAAPSPAHHPAALYFRAEIELRSGRPQEAKPWFEALAAVPEASHLPAVNLPALRQRAREFLNSSRPPGPGQPS